MFVWPRPRRHIKRSHDQKRGVEPGKHKFSVGNRIGAFFRGQFGKFLLSFCLETVDVTLSGPAHYFKFGSKQSTTFLGWVGWGWGWGREGGGQECEHFRFRPIIRYKLSSIPNHWARAEVARNHIYYCISRRGRSSPPPPHTQLFILIPSGLISITMIERQKKSGRNSKCRN